METMRLGYGVPVRVSVVEDGTGYVVDMRRCRCLRVRGRLGAGGTEFEVQDALYDDYTNTVMVRLCEGLIPEAGTYHLRVSFTDYGGRAVDTGWFEALEVREGVPRRCVVVEVTASGEYV